KTWEEKEAYVADAFRLVANADVCLKCHQVGSVPAIENQGPSLAISWERLRPNWTQQWIANPQRFLHYGTVMPANFLANKQEFQDRFVGSPAEQVQAARDYLKLYPMISDWAIFRRPAAEPSGGK